MGEKSFKNVKKNIYLTDVFTILMWKVASHQHAMLILLRCYMMETEYSNMIVLFMGNALGLGLNHVATTCQLIPVGQSLVYLNSCNSETWQRFYYKILRRDASFRSIS